MPELRISTDKIDEFLEAALEVAGKVPPTTGDNTTTGDDSALVNIEESDDDPTRDEIESFLAGLNVEERVDLLALIYLGRGDFAIDEWDDAVIEAEDRIEAARAALDLASLLRPRGRSAEGRRRASPKRAHSLDGSRFANCTINWSNRLRVP